MVVAAPLSSQTYILSSLPTAFCCSVVVLRICSLLLSVVVLGIWFVLVALSPHPPVTMSPLQLVSKRPTHDSVVPLNIHRGMHVRVEEEQVFQSSLYKDAAE